LTASSVGKASAISWSSRTRLAPSRNRSAYLPWTPSLSRSRRSYSARSSSPLSSLDFFFICLSLSTSELPCTEDTDSVPPVSMSHHQEPTGSRESEGDKPVLLFGMIWVKGSDTQWILENSSGIFESNSVLSQIHLRFSRIPFIL